MFDTRLKDAASQVQAHLDRVLGELDDLPVVQAMHYASAGGKRLRAFLVLESARLHGIAPDQAIWAATAVEALHAYSLVHDDLPCMDDDDLRRGLPTCHRQFSEATAILAGDGLLTHAFFILAAAHRLFDSFPAPGTRLLLAEKIAGAAGGHGMVEGQMLDIQAETAPAQNLGNKDLRLAHLKKIHRHKTGALIRVSVEAGALSVAATPPALSALTTYAEAIGLAFQVMDDILNVEGDPEIMGKAAGSDALHDKMTFPAIIGLDASKAFGRQLIQEAITALDKQFDHRADPLRAIAHYIINRQR